MEYEADGEMLVSGGKITSLTGGARIVLLAADADTPPLRLEATIVRFTYASSDAQNPEKIVLDGKVKVEHPNATVTAELAEWGYGNSVIVFTGNPYLESKDGTLSGERIEMNIETGNMKVSKPRGVSYQGFGGMGVANADPSLLRESDIGDWAGLIAKLKAQGGASTASPGIRVLALLPEALRNALDTMDEAAILQNKPTIIKNLNGVLSRKDLYDASAWQGVSLAPEAQALVQRGPESLQGKELTQLNRLLLEAAFPAEIVKRAQ